MELPNRRHCLRYRFEHRGFRYYGTIGVDPWTHVPCEVFLQSATPSGTDVEMVARDAGVLASIALQHGASVEELRAALTRLDNDAPAGPVAALFDLLWTEIGGARKT